MKVSANQVKAKLDTHEAVCAERWKETILRIKRLEAIFIAFSGATMLMLVSIIIKIGFFNNLMAKHSLLII